MCSHVQFLCVLFGFLGLDKNKKNRRKSQQNTKLRDGKRGKEGLIKIYGSPALSYLAVPRGQLFHSGPHVSSHYSSPRLRFLILLSLVQTLRKAWRQKNNKSEGGHWTYSWSIRGAVWSRSKPASSFSLKRQIKSPIKSTWGCGEEKTFNLNWISGQGHSLVLLPGI